MSLVSIIIPAHNPGPYLRPALESVHRQRFQEWDATVIDDNSSEDLGWVKREFPRVRYVRQSHGGVSVARNNGVLSTRGPLIAFMDQDDLWSEMKLARQMAAVEASPDAGVCYCDLAVFDESMRAETATAGSEAELNPVVVLDPRQPNPDGASPMLASLRHFSRSFVVPSTVMIRRSALATSGLLDPFIPFSGDYDLLIKLGSSHPVVRVPNTDVLYRKHANNFSDRYDVGRAEVEAMVARYVAYARAKGDAGLAAEAGRLLRRPRKLYAAQAFDCARRSLRQRDFRGTVRHLSRSVCFSPTFAAGSVTRWGLNRVAGSPPSTVPQLTTDNAQ